MNLKKTILSIALMATPLFANAALSSADVKHFAQQADLNFGVVDNFHNKDGSFIGKLVLNNTSDVALPKGKADWQLYFHSIRKIKTEMAQGLAIEHVNGDLHRVVPTSSFKGLAAGESLELPFDAQVWVVAYSDFMPRAFFVSGNNKPAVFANTDTEDFKQFVTPFTRENQLRRYNEPKDLSVLATAKVRFERNSAGCGQ